MSDIKTVLVPLDFSKGSGSALEFAKQLVRQINGSMHLIYVDDDVVLKSGMTSQDYRDEFEDQMAARLAVLVDAGERKRMNVEFFVTTGDAALEIRRYAEKHNVDMIVMGRKGRGAISEILLGSTTQKVLHQAGCPVTCVPF